MKVDSVPWKKKILSYIINVDYKRISMDYESWWIRNEVWGGCIQLSKY